MFDGSPYINNSCATAQKVVRLYLSKVPDLGEDAAFCVISMDLLGERIVAQSLDTKACIVRVPYSLQNIMSAFT